MKKLKVVFFGAGVLGSVYAAGMQEAGLDVTLVARGRRFEEVRTHGIVLEKFNSGKQNVTKVKVVDQMPQEEYFDLCVVSIQRTQLESALPELAKNQQIPAYLFMHNTITGFDPLIEALGQERVLIGHANLGGERDGHVVHYMASQKITMGELDDSVSQRLKDIAAAFTSAGFGVEFNHNMDAWKRYHMALGCPMVNAMYMVGTCNYRLSKDREALTKFVGGMREAFQVLKAHGYPIEPKKMKRLASMPDFLIMMLFKLVFGMKVMDIGGARHARNAREEMAMLSEEFLALADASKVDTPILKELHQYALNPKIV